MFNRKTNIDKPTFVRNKANRWLLIICQIVNVSTLTLELSWWMLSIICLCLFWQIMIIQEFIKQPNKALITLLAIAGCILLGVSAKELGLLSTMIHLISLSYVLKAFEQNYRSDFYQITLLGLFVVISSLIFQQSIYFALGIALLIILNFSLIMGPFTTSLSFLRSTRLSTIIVLQSIPLTVLLFIGFPKLSPLWEVPVAKSAKTGLSNSVKIGDIANLALSDELAFRVTFQGNTPLYSSMYWRAIVMEYFDGTSWETKIERNEFQNQKFRESATYSTKGEALNYQIIVSPTYQKWLYALDVARINYMKTKGLEVVHRQDYSLFSLKPITQNSSYAVTSYIQSPLALNITDYSYDKNLRIPENNNPRLVEKAKQLRSQFSDNEELIKQVLSTFNKEIYRYTLNPPKLNNNSLDEFYFETKAGFCEHFASSFTFMMRAAGIPSRLVTGYMGGEYNPQGGYFSIYQREAHAWSEVWLEGKGWVRVDPTAYINPERVERGFSDQLLQEQSDFSDSFSLLRMRNNQWLNELRLQLEALDYNWTRWVIGYTADKQSKILQNLMNDIASLKNISWSTVFDLFIITLLCVGLWWFIGVYFRGKQPTDCHYLYHKVIELLANKGVEKPLGMTAQQFVIEVNKQYPEITVDFAKFTQFYISLAYQELTDEQQEKLAKQCRMVFIKIQSTLK